VTPCSLVVHGLVALHTALAPAPPGATICLADGSYGELTVRAEKAAPGVTVRAAHPGKTTIDGAEISGSHLTLARFEVSDEIVIEPGSRKISVSHNRISGGYFGVEAGPTTSTSITDTTIQGNIFAGPFGEDAIRLNRYHDSADPDPYGVLIENNEIRGVRENGNHSDCLQSVWGGDGLYFRRNYVHDNRCQGFFVKDQPAPVAHVVLEDNLMLRNDAPCAPPNAACGPPLVVQVVGPTRGLRFVANTIWTPGNDSALALRAGPFGKVSLLRNVLYRAWSDWSGPFDRFVQAGNLACQWDGTLPRFRHGLRDCEPDFRASADDDYRLAGGIGVDWAPGQQHYGP
jgi:Right handed beta helix region